MQCSRLWQPPPVLLPGKSHGRRSLVGCSPWGHEESDTTEQLHFHFSLSCIGEGNGNPLQCSCLENPKDGGAWWAAVYGVTQSRTRLKWLSSSSSILLSDFLFPILGFKSLPLSLFQDHLDIYFCCALQTWKLFRKLASSKGYRMCSCIKILKNEAKFQALQMNLIWDNNYVGTS